MSELRFTVVTPVLNGEKYLSETIESVIGQSYPHCAISLWMAARQVGRWRLLNQHRNSDKRVTVVSSGL